MRHAKRLSGKEYVTSAGIVVSAKQPEPISCARCRFECDVKVSQEAREYICSTYYGMAHYSRQLPITEISPWADGVVTMPEESNENASTSYALQHISTLLADVQFSK